MRKLAELLAGAQPDILAVSEIGSGDSRSLATRFALQWAYRGRQALFWRAPFEPARIADLYLPMRTPLRRTGFVRVDGALAKVACTLAATQFARGRESRAAQVTFARAQLRTAKADALFFACAADPPIDVTDLGFVQRANDARASLHVFARGFDRVKIDAMLTDV
jgi:hypothetical protein